MNNDPNTMGLRPYRSDNGPTKIWNTAFIPRNNEIDSVVTE